MVYRARREKLNELMAARGWGEGALKDAAGISHMSAHGVVAGECFGRSIAYALVEAFGMDALELIEAVDGDEEAVAAAERAGAKAEAALAA